MQGELGLLYWATLPDAIAKWGLCNLSTTECNTQCYTTWNALIFKTSI